MKVILMTVILTSIVAIQVEDAIPAAMRKKLGLNLPVVSLSNEEHSNTTFLQLSDCWSSKLVGKYVKEQHGKTNECYSFAVAKSKCEAAKDCGAIATQSNVCGGKYRVTHGGPTLQTYGNWKAYNLWAYTFSRKSNCGKDDNGYIGCYTDDGNRDLFDGPKKYGYRPNTCAAACAKYKYFALQNGGWCVCGNAYATEPKYKKVADSQCKGGQGGAWRNAVYSVGGKDAHESIFDLLVAMKKSIKESKLSAIKTATGRCTANTAAKVVKAEKTFSDGTKYFDLQGCAAGSKCETSTEKEQKIAVAANKKLKVLNAIRDGLEKQIQALTQEGNKNKATKDDFEKKIKDNNALHKARMKRFKKVIAALTKIQKNLKETGKITWESLMSEEEHNAVGSFKVGKMLLMLSQGVDGDGQKDLVNKLKPLIATFLKRLGASEKRELAAHKEWNSFITAKISGLRKDDLALVKKKAALGEKKTRQ